MKKKDEPGSARSDEPRDAGAGDVGRPGSPRTRTWSRICGLETEYALLYVPEDPSSDRVPPFSLLESILFRSLLEDRKVARSLGIKGGYFIENGGLAHLELFLYEQEDTPILELSTPECSNPRDLLAYQRAFDDLLVDVSERSVGALAEAGYRGRLAFGKNNLDSRGVGYGCHENYLTNQRLPWPLALLFVLGAPFILLVALPWLLLLLTLLLLVLVAFAVYLSALLVVRGLEVTWPEAGHGLRKFFADLPHRIPRGVLQIARRGYMTLATCCQYPWVSSLTVLLRLVAHRPFVRNLTGFLVTRSVICGSGHLDPRTGRFELSQRAGLTRSLSKVVMSGRSKTIFDLKGFLYRPLSLFRARQRLSLCCGDSNLSDVPNLLKVGATMLVLDMIEDGEDLSDLRPARPVTAFREISTGGPWKHFWLRRRRQTTAIDVQREYLRRAREYVARSHPGDVARAEILDLWEHALAAVADDPVELARTLDSAAKKSILDRAILPATNWKTFGRWSRVIDRLRRGGSVDAPTLDEALAGLSPWRRRRLRRKVSRLGLDASEFPAMRDLVHQCRKIDLRFHEISCDPGYQRRLEAEDQIRRLLDDDAVRVALTEAPADTRARQRSYYIRLNDPGARSSVPVRAGWDRVVVGQVKPRTISLGDPFDSRIPTD